MLSAVGFFLILLFLGMPVAFAIAVSGFSFFLMRPEIPWTILVQKSLSTTQSFTMLAIPLFIFAGNLMNNTGITSRLVKLANVLTGLNPDGRRIRFRCCRCSHGMPYPWA